MSEENKQFVRRFLSTMDAQEWGAFAEMMTPDHKFHSPLGPPMGRDEHVRLDQDFFKSFDARHHILDMVAEGDKVAVRGKTTMVHRGEFQGIPPTGKSIELPWLDIMRIEGGKNAEEWLSMDLMGLMQQLGA
jgi:predicted ester cyclase